MNPETNRPGYPFRLDSLEVNETFRMLGYEGIYRVVQLPETYELLSGRTSLRKHYESKRKPLFSPTIITVTPDGDGTHRPILGPDGKVFLMSRQKPVARIGG